MSILSVGLSVLPLAINVNSGKTADLTEMPFEVVGLVCPWNHVLDKGWGPPPPNFAGKWSDAM